MRGDEGISRDASLVQSDDDAGMRWRRLLHCSVEGGARGERGGMGEMGHDVDKEKRLVPTHGETALFGSCSHCRERRRTLQNSALGSRRAARRLRDVVVPLTRLNTAGTRFHGVVWICLLGCSCLPGTQVQLW